MMSPMIGSTLRLVFETVTRSIIVSVAGQGFIYRPWVDGFESIASVREEWHFRSHFDE